MALYERRITRTTQVGVAAGIFSCVAAGMALAFMLPQWDFSEMVINLGPKRSLGVMLATGAAAVSGVVGLLMSLQGAADLEGRWRKLGWLGFFCGIVGALGGVILGLCGHFYRM